MNRRMFFKITAGLTALFSGVKAFALQPKTNLDRVCLRRLLLEIKKFTTQASRHYVFDTNTEETRKSFCNVMNSYLTDLKNRRAFNDYKFVCDETNNFHDELLVGEIFIQPAKAVEYVVLDFSIYPTKLEKDYDLTGWDYVSDPLPGYEIKDV